MLESLKVAPYFNNYSETLSEYYKALFVPGRSVQVSELNNVQSMLSSQTGRFGAHFFKHGSVVLPGNITSNLSAHYITVTLTSGAIDKSAILNGNLLNVSSGITAAAVSIEDAINTDPLTIYIAYTGGSSTATKTFSVGQTVTAPGALFNVTSVGIGSTVHISKGVYFINGRFVDVEKQSVAIDKYSNTPSKHILLKITESITDSDVDVTLLEPNGRSLNYLAPGADRLNITLKLVTLPLGSTITEDYVEIMRYNLGVLEHNSRNTEYGEFDKSVARRTYDKSGDYRVSGMELDIHEHLRAGINGGLYELNSSIPGDKDKFVVSVSPGKSYISGYEVETISKTIVPIDKGRSASDIKSSRVGAIANYGKFLYVSDIKGLPSFSVLETAELIDSTQSDGSGASIGTVQVRAIVLDGGSSVATNIYRLYIDSIQLNAGNFLTDVGAIRFSGGSTAALTATVLHRFDVSATTTSFSANEVVNAVSGKTATVFKYTKSKSEMFVFKNSKTSVIPVKSEKIIGTSGAGGIITKISSTTFISTKPALVYVGQDSPSSIKTAAGTVDMSYKVLREISVATNASGAATSTAVSNGTIDTITPFNTVICSTTTNYPSSIASTNGSTISISGGPISTTLKLVITITKTLAAPKLKTFSTLIETKAPDRIISLSRADVINVVSVTSTIDGDVTNRFELDTGQRDHAYLLGSLKLRSGLSVPLGTLTINYNYFSHSGTGDYFSIDSYAGSGISNYYDNVPKYISNRAEYDLINCLDLRPRVSDAGSYIGAGSSLIEFIPPSTKLVTSLNYYTPRTDMIVSGKTGKIYSVRGLPLSGTNLKTPPAGTILLAIIKIPAYVHKISDVQILKTANKTFTMSNISDIDDRIFGVENFASATNDEQNLIAFDLLDAATGLRRSKSGYLIEDFRNPDSVAEVYDTEFSATYNVSGTGTLIPKIETNDIDLTEIHNGGITSGGITTLNYTTTVFAAQPLSSRITNLNPYLITSWSGNLILTPSRDEWIEQEYLPNLANTFVTNTGRDVQLTRPWDWQPSTGDIVIRRPSPQPIFVNIFGQEFNTATRAVVQQVQQIVGVDFGQDFGPALL